MGSGDQNSVIIVFDEVFNLEKNVRYCLRRLTRIFGKLPIWTLFLSTTSTLPAIQPSLAEEISSRFVGGELKRLPPVIGLQLDLEDCRIMADPTEMAEELSRPLIELSSRKHLCIFGRPLWRIHEDSSYRKLTKFVKHKLMGGTDFSVDKAEHIFAILAARVGLDPVPSPDTWHFISEAVNRHLRIAVAVDSDTGCMTTVTPSEPVVSEVATDLLMTSHSWVRGNAASKSRLWPVAIHNLESKLLSPGLVEKGLKGELYARIICLLAHDYGVQYHNTKLRWEVGTAEPCFWSQPLKLLDFFYELLPEADYIRLSRCSNKRKPQLRSARGKETEHPVSRSFADRMGNAYINFTHFVTTDRNLESDDTVELAHDLLRRCAALQLNFVQPAWDILIPVYYGNPRMRFEPDNVSVIVIQVKNTKARNPLGLVPKDYKMLGIDPALPIISMMFDLGVETGPATFKTGICGKSEIWTIDLKGPGSGTFRVVDHKGLGGACESLLSTITPPDSINNAVCLRNYRFAKHSRKERYTVLGNRCGGSQTSGEGGAGGHPSTSAAATTQELEGGGDGG